MTKRRKPWCAGHGRPRMGSGPTDGGPFRLSDLSHRWQLTAQAGVNSRLTCAEPQSDSNA